MSKVMTWVKSTLLSLVLHSSSIQKAPCEVLGVAFVAKERVPALYHDVWLLAVIA